MRGKIVSPKPCGQRPLLDAPPPVQIAAPPASRTAPTFPSNPIQSDPIECANTSNTFMAAPSASSVFVPPPPLMVALKCSIGLRRPTDRAASPNPARPSIAGSASIPAALYLRQWIKQADRDRSLNSAGYRFAASSSDKRKPVAQKCPAKCVFAFKLNTSALPVSLYKIRERRSVAFKQNHPNLVELSARLSRTL